MKVTVDLPPRIFWRIADLAERRGTTVAQILVEGTAPFARYDKPVNEQVRELHQLGFTDGDIAYKTGLTRTSVAERRRRMGLLPNKQRRK